MFTRRWRGPVKNLGSVARFKGVRILQNDYYFDIFFHLLKLRGSYTQDMSCLSTAPLLAYTPALEGLPSLIENGRGVA